MMSVYLQSFVQYPISGYWRTTIVDEYNNEVNIKKLLDHMNRKDRKDSVSDRKDRKDRKDQTSQISGYIIEWGSTPNTHDVRIRGLDGLITSAVEYDIKLSPNKVSETLLIPKVTNDITSKMLRIDILPDSLYLLEIKDVDGNDINLESFRIKILLPDVIIPVPKPKVNSKCIIM